MKFQFEKLGYFEKNTEIELGDLTLICGKNNTGKTYASYAIYGFLATWQNQIQFHNNQNDIEKLINNGVVELDLQKFEKDIPTVLDELSRQYTQLLPSIFSTNEAYFSESLFRALITTNYQANYYPHKMDLQLYVGRKKILKVLKEKDSYLLEIILQVDNKNRMLPIIKDSVNRVIGQILLDNYFANPFIITSERTGVSLFHRELDQSKNVWVEQLQEQGKNDEPEQNLHPANQRKMARLFVRLIKMGIKVFVTTHSDYLIKELNNLIILGNKFEDREEIMEKYQYTEEDVLDKSLVRVYNAEKQTLVPAPIDDLGITLSSFDLEVREMNDMFDDMTMTMEIAYQ